MINMEKNQFFHPCHSGFKKQSVISMKYSIMATCLLFTLSSCFKEKPMAAPRNQGMGQMATIDMGADYADQYYYSLESNRVISFNSRFDYDLMFECNANRFYIWLNTAKFMSVIRTDKTDIRLTSMADTASKNWMYELGEFSDDSNAIGHWWATFSNQPTSKNEVYIINLGVDNENKQLGFAKLQIHDFNGSSYSISYAEVNSQDIHTSLVTKDPTRNYRYFSFSDAGKVLDGIEPDKSQWDLCFTRFSVVFYEPYYLPYQVTGVLTNPSKVSAYLDSTYTFNEVKLADFDANRLQTRRDIIGYEWKRYEWGDYTTKTWYTYFIKADEDKFYKLRFLDFKKAGVWGYPTFEYYRL